MPDSGNQASQAQRVADAEGNGVAPQTQTVCEAALEERDVRINELEHEIAEADITAESTEGLRPKMDKPGVKARNSAWGFKLRLAGTGTSKPRGRVLRL